MRTLAVLIALISAAPAAAQSVTQPPQPKKGPGSSHYPHADVRITQGGTGSDAWYVFEPVKPRPKSAPLAVVMHGYFEFEGYDNVYALARHTVRKGNVVIYPRWQTGINEPCPGPFDIEPCITSAVNGINGGLAYLEAKKKRRVQPDLKRASYFGFSFGGIVTSNFLNRWKSLELPKPRAVFLDDPHDGGYTGPDEPALDASLAGIPARTLVQCHAGADGVFNDPYTGTSDPTALGQPKAGGSCNSVFPKLTSIPAENKDLVLTQTDAHGEPALSSDHGVCGPGESDAYDWNFCWKVWDALRECAYYGRWCKAALGNTRKHRSNGKWSDGTPVARLKIQDAAPIAP